MRTKQALSAIGFIVVGCGSEQRRPTQPAATRVDFTETTVSSAPVDVTRVSPSISVDEEIARRCHLQFGDVAMAPKFAFDRSDLQEADLDVLHAIARCLTNGPLEGRSIKLVGRADPRGPEQYNIALGARRAHSAALFLEQFGVEVGRMHETSRGELDARGTDEASWQVDRRVDLVLGD